jgi:L-rhamnose-H+ transport protein
MTRHAFHFQAGGRCMSDLLVGFILVTIGSILQGSWAVPMGFTKKWQWENTWLIYSLLSMIAFNLIIGSFLVPNLFRIYSSAFPLVLPIIGFGIVWGSGVVLFGLGIAAVGLALSYALMYGALLAFGAIVPMLVVNPSDLVTPQGIVAMIGVLVSLVGIAYSGKAGMMKEIDQSGTGSDGAANAKISMKMGIAICIIAGALISVVNIVFATSGALVESAKTLGFDPKFTGNLVWGAMFSTGGVVNFFYCSYLLGKNKTGANFTTGDTGRNWLLVILMALIWIISFNFYGQGAVKMGKWGPVIGWSMFNIIPIATANFWAIGMGEWKGTKPATKKVMGIALVLFLAAIIIFTYGASL